MGRTMEWRCQTADCTNETSECVSVTDIGGRKLDEPLRVPVCTACIARYGLTPENTDQAKVQELVDWARRDAALEPQRRSAAQPTHGRGPRQSAEGRPTPCPHEREPWWGDEPCRLCDAVTPENAEKP